MLDEGSSWEGSRCDIEARQKEFEGFVDELMSSSRQRERSSRRGERQRERCKDVAIASADSMSDQDHHGNRHEGEWVQVQKGIYRGDSGLIDRVYDWGAKIILLPRLSPDMDNDIKRKRKASFLRPAPCIFDPTMYESAKNVKIRRIDDHTYAMGKLKLEYGMLAKEYEFSSIKPFAGCIPYHVYAMFDISRHPRVLKSPALRPLEWMFTEGDPVVDSATGKHGTVVATSTNRVEIDLGEEGVKSVSWRNVKKRFSAGDPITVTGGTLSGRTGWVVSIQNNIATIVDKEVQGSQAPNVEQQIVSPYIYIYSGRKLLTTYIYSFAISWRNMWQ